MTKRRRLPNRRGSESFELESQGVRFTATISRFPDRSLAEILLQSHKAGSMAGIDASHGAVVASIALQYGVPLSILRKALMRETRSNPSGPLAAALDMVAGSAP